MVKQTVQELSSILISMKKKEKTNQKIASSKDDLQTVQDKL